MICLLSLMMVCAAQPDGDLMAGAEARIRAHRTGDLVISVVDPAGKPVKDATVSVTQARHDFLFGCNIYALFKLGNPQLEKAYQERFKALWNFATIGFYWSSFERSKGRPGYDYAARVAAWCREQGITTKGHPLVWNHPAGVPFWLTGDPEEAHKLSVARTFDCVKRLKGAIDIWDVVNEAVDPFRFKEKHQVSSIIKKIGMQPFLHDAFNAARRANPGAKLLINDYRVDPKYHGIIKMLKTDDGFMCDYIGLQSHMHGGVWPARRIWDVCERFRPYNLPLQFTEATLVSGKRSEGRRWGPTEPALEEKQARQAEMFYTMVFSHPSVTALTWWDFCDAQAWQGAAAGFLRKDGSTKPIYDTLHKLIKEAWWTRTEKKMSDLGGITMPAFFGRHEVSATVGGKTVTTTVDFPRPWPPPLNKRAHKKVMLTMPASAAKSASESPTAWPVVGKVKPRHAREIKASPWSVGAETMDRDYTIYANWKDYLGPLGVKKARIQGGWAKTEKKKGIYAFGWLDEIIHDMHAQGVEPWMCLCYGNKLYAEGGGVRLGAQLPAGGDALQAWLKWVCATVERYKDIIDEWEVWNEPDLRRANAAKVYAAFLMHTARRIKAIQPKARILAMSTAGVNLGFVEKVLAAVKAQDALDLIDQVTYHPYAKNPDTSYDAVDKLRQVVRSFAPHITLRQGENGCPSMRRKTKALRDYDWTETAQAKWALRRLLGDFSAGIPSSYFAIMDMKYPDEMNAKGLLRSRPDQTVAYAKPAYWAVQHLASIFDDAVCLMDDVSVKVDSPRPVSAFAFKHTGTGCPGIALWIKDKIPSDDNAMTPLNVTCSLLNIPDPVYVDVRTGIVQALPEGTMQHRDFKTYFKGIPVYDSPILITGRTVIPLDR